jgi:hypothetical protein
MGEKRVIKPFRHSSLSWSNRRPPCVVVVVALDSVQLGHTKTLKEKNKKFKKMFFSFFFVFLPFRRLLF